MFNRGRYNPYRKRSFSLSDTKRKEYAKNMNEIKEYFDDNPSWSISYHLDSAYCYYERFQLRLSNHSADNMYHELNNSERLLVNVKCSKLDFINTIENNVDSIVKFVNTLELDKYRFINIVGYNVNCYLKGYKTKKETYDWRD